MVLPLATLIADCLAQLSLTPHGLAARLGYTNTNKGCRRLQSLMEGHLAEHHEILSRLADALQVSPEEVARAVRATEAAKEEGYRASFVPHAVILTEQTIPTQITLCAVTRGEGALRITLDTTQPRASYARQARTEMNRRANVAAGVKLTHLPIES